MHKTPVLGYIREDKLHLDLRTVFPDEEKELLAAINEILGQTHTIKSE